MILHQIEAASVGPFVGPPVVAGPFAPGMNILAAPNETGKTTLLRAAGRALFDRHTCKDLEIRALRPAGSALSPRVVVDFETAAGCFRIDKTFLQGPRSVLFERVGGEWKPVAEADAADARVQALLQSSQPGRGATKAAHWGLLGYLWTRQGEPSAWPDWQENPVGSAVKGMLAKVEIDPFIDSLRGHLWSAYLENFTPTGQARVGGMLRKAEEELVGVDRALTDIDETRRQFIADEDAYARLADELPRLEAEHADCRREADELQAAARHSELQTVEVQKHRHAFEIAQDRLKSVRQDAETLARHTRELDDTRRQLAVVEADAELLRVAALAADARLAEGERALEENAALLARQQENARRAGRLARHRQLGDTIQGRSLLLERCVAQTAEIEALTLQRAEIPTVAPARLRKIEALTESVRDHRAKIEALGLTVELIPSADRPPLTVRADDGPGETLSDLRVGETRVLRANRGLWLDLPGWGSLRMRSGAAETRALTETMAADEAALQQACAELGARHLEEARHFATRAKELDAGLAAARQTLAAVLGKDESLEALRAKLAAERRQWQTLEDELALTPGERAVSMTELEAAEQTATVQYEGLRIERKSLETRYKEQREAAGEAVARRDAAERQIFTLRMGNVNLQAQAGALQARYPAGPDAARDEAEETFVEAKHLLRAAEAKLPPDAATLSERNRRAAAAAEQVRGELGRKRDAQAMLRGRLELLGAKALYTEETLLLARRGALAAQVGHARTRSRAARLLHDLVERRKHAATRSVLAPLQERLGARFGEVSGERDRRIFLDESLQVRGLGRKDDELVSFDDLSQGAREQLLLCLRLAVAEELIAVGSGPQSLILDDVLVNTDAVRQKRVLDVLAGAAAGGLQILVCTCHPDRYRGVGEVVELRRQAVS